jgi:hypothetical protein
VPVAHVGDSAGDASPLLVADPVPPAFVHIKTAIRRLGLRDADEVQGDEAFELSAGLEVVFPDPVA